jgi:hypothetical protein
MVRNDGAQCIDPRAITPEDRIAYVDGEANAGVVEHVRRCAYCADEVRALASTQSRLQVALYRFDCPPAQLLGDYALDLLSADERTRVASHVVECPRCTDELQTLRSFLSVEPAPQATAPAGPVERLMRIVATLASPPVSAPAYAMLRGGETPGSQIYRAGSVSITLTVEPEPQRGRYTLAGLVIQEDGEAAPPADGVQLFWGEQMVEAQSLGDLGNFAFEALSAGEYRLEMRVVGGIIAVETIRIGDT